MADNTRMKEIYAELKKNADAIDLVSTSMTSQIERLEVAGHAQMTRMEEFQQANAAQFSQLNTTLAHLLQRLQTSPQGVANSSVKEPQRNAFQVRSVKLDFPRFDGKNVMDWIFKAEQFFDYYATPDADRLIIASVHLDHEVVPWYQMLQKTAPFHSWKAFTRALELDFGPSTYDCPRATLFKLNQSATVNEYYMQFTTLANRVDGLSVEAILDCFISGLNNEISRDVKAMEPRTLTKAVALAKLFEEKYFPNTTPKITAGPRNVTQNSTIPTKPTANYPKSD